VDHRITAGDELCLRFIPDNSDASFVSPRKPKPAEVLLHYNYGAAAVKTWEKNNAILSNRLGLQRPQEPRAEPMGPTRSVGDRSKAVYKLKGVKGAPLIMAVVRVQAQPQTRSSQDGTNTM
jgi:hypothetical protein